MTNDNEINFITVKESMTKEIITFTKKTKVSEAIVILAKNKISGAPVVDEKNRVIGIFTESDILRYFNVHPNQKLNMLDIPIIYTEKVITTNINTPIYLVQKIFVQEGIRAIPVVEENNFLKGVISRRDVLKYIYIVNKRIKNSQKKE